MILESIEDLQDALQGAGYIAERALASALFVAAGLQRPILLEGEPGAGKTAAAEALALSLRGRLLRLQCYEGLAAHDALYEWDYGRQILTIRLAEARQQLGESLEQRLFDMEFLLKRPLLEAVTYEGKAPLVLLIDEVDRADEEFEGFLLEFLSGFQVTVPEIGTIVARRPPLVVLTSNQTRPLSAALRRRCIYHWIPEPSLEKESAILRTRVPDAPDRLTDQVAAFCKAMRSGSYRKTPGTSESIDWLRSLLLLDVTRLEPLVVDETIGCLLKEREDVARYFEADRQRLSADLGDTQEMRPTGTAATRRL